MRMNFSPVISQGDRDEEDLRVTFRYKRGSHVDLIIQYLRENRVNVSEFLRELLMATKGVEVFQKHPEIRQTILEKLGKQSILYLSNAIESIRLNLNLNSRNSQSFFEITDGTRKNENKKIEVLSRMLPE